jgi:hypothetical protein
MKRFILTVCVFCLICAVVQAANNCPNSATCPNGKCQANVLDNNILKYLPDKERIVIRTDNTKIPMIFEKIDGRWVVKVGKKVVQKAKSVKAVLDDKILEKIKDKRKVEITTKGDKVPMVFEKINEKWEININKDVLPLPVQKVEPNVPSCVISEQTNLKKVPRYQKCGRRGFFRFINRPRIRKLRGIFRCCDKQ